MKLGLLTCFWKRWALSRVFMDYWAHLRIDGVEIIPAASYSYDGHNWRTALRSHGWRSVQVPNKPIGRKFNRALELLTDCDAVLVVGSDDFSSRGWIRYGLRQLRTNEMVGLESFYMYSPALNRLVYLQNTQIGGGRFYRRSLLERVNWSLWNPGKNRALDASAIQRINWCSPTDWPRLAVGDVRAKNAMHLGVKAGDPEQKNDNIWSFHEVLGAHGDNYDCDPALLERYLGKETAKRIRELR